MLLAQAVMVIVALAASFLILPIGWQDGVFLGCWISVAATALTVHLPKGLGRTLALFLALNAGIWVGAVISTAGDRLDLFKSLPVALVCWPAAWLVARNKGIVIKVVSSWLIAVALLAAGLTIVPTPGYKPDHMD